MERYGTKWTKYTPPPKKKNKKTVTLHLTYKTPLPEAAPQETIHRGQPLDCPQSSLLPRVTARGSPYQSRHDRSTPAWTKEIVGFFFLMFWFSWFEVGKLISIYLFPDWSWKTTTFPTFCLKLKNYHVFIKIVLLPQPQYWFQLMRICN